MVNRTDYGLNYATEMVVYKILVIRFQCKSLGVRTRSSGPDCGNTPYD